MNEMIKKLVDAYGQKLIDNRRYLHAHPELSFKETQTAAWIRQHLQAAGIPMLTGIHGNSTVGYLKGSTDGLAIGQILMHWVLQKKMTCRIKVSVTV